MKFVRLKIVKGYKLTTNAGETVGHVIYMTNGKGVYVTRMCNNELRQYKTIVEAKSWLMRKYNPRPRKAKWTPPN